MTPDDWKLVAAICVLVGIGFNFLGLLRAPSALLLEESASPSPWLKWGGWAFPSLAAVAYIALDHWKPLSVGEPWRIALPYVIGYVVALGMGQVSISLIAGPLWKGLGLPNDNRHGYGHSGILGLVESTLYVSALLASHGEFIAVWLGLKTVIRWRHWETDIAVPGKTEGEETTWVLGRMAYNLFLLGNALVILYSAIGWKVIVSASAGAWGQAFAIVLGAFAWSLVMAALAKRCPAYPPLKRKDPRLKVQ